MVHSFKFLLVVGFFLAGSCAGFAQSVQVEPYLFVSKSKDTIPAELWSLKVPLDRTKSSSDSTVVKFIRLPSSSPNPATPIVYLAGGPGGSGIETAKGGRFRIFNELRKTADLILLDQRGTGLSNSIPPCPYRTGIELNRPVGQEEYLLKSLETLNQCFEFWERAQVDIWAYNTTENARDIEDVRIALGKDKISLWGLSYGSQLGFEYVRLYKKNVDKLVLASLEGNEETIKLPSDNDAFLKRIAALASDNYGSDKKYPNLMETIQKVHASVRSNPLKVPIVGMTGSVDTIGISDFELQSAIAAFYMKNPEDSKRLPYIYEQMASGSYEEIAQRVIAFKFYALNSIQPMALAMDLKNGISKKRTASIEKEIPQSILSTSPNFLFYDWMKELDYTPLPQEFRKMNKNKVDALLFSGTLDGRTYLPSGIRLASKFKNGNHIIVENGGHDLYDHAPEVVEELVKFFRNEPSQTKVIRLSPTYFD